MNKYDSIIIGGGHNGLVCAAYLSKFKKKVLLIEKKEVLGGLAKYSDFTSSFSKKILSLSSSGKVKEYQINYKVFFSVIKEHNFNFTPVITIYSSWCI